MRPRVLRLTASTKEERHSAINRIREAMSRGGAVILDFKMFSNRTINFIFEIRPDDVQRLHDCLTGIGLALFEEPGSISLIEANHLAQQKPDSDIPGTLQITFIHNEPDLRIEVPPFDL